jgi:2-polyprenyl-3-methyl-5-hydroxy-6-metoxy-1,4-benzoquinol methylase
MERSLRTTAFAQTHKLSFVDNLGRRLSARMILKTFKQLKKPFPNMLDIGCGYDAWMLILLYPFISHGVAIDMALSEKIKKLKKITVYEQSAEFVISKLQDDNFDFILMNSVLEHFDDPLNILVQCHSKLASNGMLIINVPTWKGKHYLETSAFILKLSPALEMDDHKMYYDKKDLWPVLVKAGFKPSMIRLKYHKFGLNLFAVCSKS